MLTVIFFIFVLLTLAVAVFLAYVLWASFSIKAPFISLPAEVVPGVIVALGLSEGSKLYEFGCGDGRILLACQKAQPRAKCIGIEKNIFAFCVAKIKLLRAGRPKGISIVRADFFAQDISDATHIFVYLFPVLLNELLPKFQKELKPGSVVVSCDYTFKNKEPNEVIDLERPNNSLGRKIFIYKF